MLCSHLPPGYAVRTENFSPWHKITFGCCVVLFRFNVLTISIRRGGFSSKAKAAEVKGSSLSWHLQRLDEFFRGVAGRGSTVTACGSHSTPWWLPWLWGRVGTLLAFPSPMLGLGNQQSLLVHWAPDSPWVSKDWSWGGEHWS